MSGQTQAMDTAAALRVALAHHEAGRLDQAEAGYRAILRADPAHADAMHLLGVIAQLRGRNEEAAGLIRRALAAMPDFPDGHMNLGNALRGLGRFSEARAAYEKALSLRPAFPLALTNLALLENDMGAHKAAEMHARRALEMAPGQFMAWVALAVALRAQRRLPEAIAAFREALVMQPDHAATLSDLASALGENNQLDAALAAHRRALALDPDSPVLHNALGMTHINAGNIPEALAALQRAVELAPHMAMAWLNLGWCHRGLGRFDAARAAFERALEINPNMAEAHWNLSLIGPAGEAERAKEADLRAMQDNAAAPIFSRVAAGFALGKMLDEQDRYDDAFAAYRAANDLFRASRIEAGEWFDAEMFSAEIDWIIAATGSDRYAACARAWAVPSDLPVFIVGMPRSGTTLVEQILASHSAVHGAGELRDIFRIAGELAAVSGGRPYSGVIDPALPRRLAAEHLERLARLGGGKRHVIDKTPDNVILMGTIGAIFPGARVIICNRDPRDNCLSNYFQLYTSGNIFAYDLAECGWRARETERLIAHWRGWGRLRMIEVQYESLVADLEGEARRMLDFLGLDWEPACLEFHRTERPVATPNMWAVRQPIYNRAVGRWQRYQKHLGPLFAALDGARPIPPRRRA
jgi:tetratricopeptide (TPR) repeat protein